MEDKIFEYCCVFYKIVERMPEREWMDNFVKLIAEKNYVELTRRLHPPGSRWRHAELHRRRGDDRPARDAGRRHDHRHRSGPRPEHHDPAGYAG